MWFPELFQRIERYGGSACAPVDANFSTDIPEFDICQPVSSIVYLEGFLTALSNLPGNIFTIIMIDKLGRRSLLSKYSSLLFSKQSLNMNLCKANRILVCLKNRTALHDVDDVMKNDYIYMLLSIIFLCIGDYCLFNIVNVTLNYCHILKC